MGRLSPARSDCTEGAFDWPIVLAATSAVSCAMSLSFAGSPTTSRTAVSSYAPQSSMTVMVLAEEEVIGDWSAESCVRHSAPKLTFLFGG